MVLTEQQQLQIAIRALDTQEREHGYVFTPDGGDMCRRGHNNWHLPVHGGRFEGRGGG